MPKKSVSEIKSEPNSSKESPIRLLLAVGIIIFGTALLFNGISSVVNNKQNLLTPNGVISVEVADNPQTRQKGLSGRENLADNEGMLFIFDDVDTRNCFWMKDMKLTIDMVWLDEDKKVVTLETGVSPDTYPQSFCPDEPVKYGLEIGNERARELGINVGTKLKF